jgi:hypothetical protein
MKKRGCRGCRGIIGIETGGQWSGSFGNWEILRWKPRCTKLLGLRAGGGWRTIAQKKNIPGCWNCYLDRTFCKDHFNPKNRACAFACIPHFSWKGQMFRRKVVQKGNEIYFQFLFFFPASVSISDINKTDIFLEFEPSEFNRANPLKFKK